MYELYTHLEQSFLSKKSVQITFIFIIIIITVPHPPSILNWIWIYQ